ncbi:hypothetical protein I553_5170 [Mycobacterium xenopi 4042]|uniref:Uncharacterized protein n=1 Tax=Mycobacterium xenopi 4042 TaxID=1299334 RepID=X7ZVS4_MYCXE|nr:hypothetical protein I553_5170 [Mycobacterium xenopi 4042]
MFRNRVPETEFFLTDRYLMTCTPMSPYCGDTNGALAARSDAARSPCPVAGLWRSIH